MKRKILLLAALVCLGVFVVWSQLLDRQAVELWNTPDSLVDNRIFSQGDVNLQLGLFFEHEEVRRDIVIGTDPYSESEQFGQLLNFRHYRRIDIPGIEQGISWSSQGSHIAFESIDAQGSSLIVYTFDGERVTLVPDSQRLLHYWWWDDTQVVFTTTENELKLFSTESAQLRILQGFGPSGFISTQRFRDGIMVVLDDPETGAIELYFGGLTTPLFEHIDGDSLLPFLYRFEETITFDLHVRQGQVPVQHTFQGFSFVEMCRSTTDNFCTFYIGNLEGSEWVRSVQVAVGPDLQGLEALALELYTYQRAEFRPGS